MRWTVHGERVIYDSPWVRAGEVPDGLSLTALCFAMAFGSLARTIDM